MLHSSHRKRTPARIIIICHLCQCPDDKKWQTLVTTSGNQSPTDGSSFCPPPASQFTASSDITTYTLGHQTQIIYNFHFSFVRFARYYKRSYQVPFEIIIALSRNTLKTSITKFTWKNSDRKLNREQNYIQVK